MNLSKFVILGAFLLVLAVPFFARKAKNDGPPPDPKAPTLVIVTPHIEQIRTEFARGFSAWHKRKHGSEVRIDWRYIGGTTEIRKQLDAQVTAAVKAGRFTRAAPGAMQLADPDKLQIPEAVLTPGVLGYDLFFGGGTYEHSKVKQGLLLDDPAKPSEKLRARLTAPADFTEQELVELYGKNEVGAERLYDPDQYWCGTALSGFGIVYNRPLLKARGMSEPRSFKDLGDYRYAGLLAMADARQSGSLATAYDSILNNQGWEEGWRTIRELCANARYFAAASTTPPQDVAQGDALAGVAIDFYGRAQGQAVARRGERAEDARVGYIDPVGQTYIDADPVSILNGATNLELSRRFVRFCLTIEGQALWQFPSTSEPEGADNPKGEDGKPMGPTEFRLRRMPVRRVMYAAPYVDHFVDKTDPYAAASPTKPKGWRDALGVMMAAFGIDTAEELRGAWRALNEARLNPSFPKERLAEMERLFYALPECRIGKEGAEKAVAFTAENYKAVSDDTNKWRDPVKSNRARIAYTEFFRANYERVVELAAQR